MQYCQPCIPAYWSDAGVRRTGIQCPPDAPVRKPGIRIIAYQCPVDELASTIQCGTIPLVAIPGIAAVSRDSGIPGIKDKIMRSSINRGGVATTDRLPGKDRTTQVPCFTFGKIRDGPHRPAIQGDFFVAGIEYFNKPVTGVVLCRVAEFGDDKVGAVECTG